MEKVKIRKATLTDLDILLGFEQQNHSKRSAHLTRLLRKMIPFYDYCGHDLKGSNAEAEDIEVVVATIDSEIIGSGYARIESSKIYLKHQNTLI